MSQFRGILLDYNNKGRLLIDLSTLNSLMVNYPLVRPKKISNWNRFDSISAMVATQLPNQDVKLGFPTCAMPLKENFIHILRRTPI